MQLVLGGPAIGVIKVRLFTVSLGQPKVHDLYMAF